VQCSDEKQELKEEKKMDSLLSMSIPLFSLSQRNITISQNDMQIIFVVVRRRGEYD
jgi:hypothetical protein